MTDTISREDRTAMAGELALGLLEGEERAAALRLMLADPDFAKEVEKWRHDTGAMFGTIEPVAPPADVWRGIEQRIKPAPANDNQRSGFWRGLVAGAGGIAAMVAAVMLWPSSGADPQNNGTGAGFAVAQLSGPIEGLRIATRFDPATDRLHVRATGMPETQTEPELWIVPADGVPRSLGQIKRDGTTVLRVADAHSAMITASAQFALSMEPPSAAPHAAPSSPMVAQGAIDLI
jgi:anti-sigma-K factor RskA